MKKKPEPLPEETIQALIQLGEVLRPIRDRLIAEGKAKIVKGRLVIIKSIPKS
jgi:hypothetical protein